MKKGFLQCFPDVSRETIMQLEDYVDLVVKWNPAINLVSTGDLENIWDRHIEDSAQIVRLTDVGSSWVDLGSGGGFPGIVVAILLKTLSHSTKVVLVESAVGVPEISPVPKFKLNPAGKAGLIV